MSKDICHFLVWSLFGANAEITDTRKNYVVEKHSWIKVPWTTGGWYYHNTETREDRDTLPPGVEL